MQTKNKHCVWYTPLIAVFMPMTISAATLQASTWKAWEQYLEAANLRMEQRLGSGSTFLWAEEEPDRLARVRAGQIGVSPVGPENPKRVPSGLIHDWVGAVFIADTTLQDVLKVVTDYAHYKDWYLPSVVDSKVIATGAIDRFSMVAVNKSFLLKTALDADYESRYVSIDQKRGYSTSRMTRLQEIQDYGTPTQHTLREGEGTGLVWRLFTITRYSERDGGVYVEREAIGLSRDIPTSMRWLAAPIVRRVSRGTLWTSLRQTEIAVKRGRLTDVGILGSR
jgi:hypothetical protein